MAQLILASQSPRRRELLKLISSDFIVCPDDSLEKADSSLSPDKYVLKLAADKCKNVACMFPDTSIVIGADTVVALEGKIFGKPHDKQDAENMLKALSGNKHSVYTGVTVMQKSENKIVSFCEKTDVYFFKLDDEDIKRYVLTGEPMDKAGSYGIQEKGALFVEKICGDYNNVVGLPIARLAKILKNEFNFFK